jgi:hypothetical protein
MKANIVNLEKLVVYLEGPLKAEFDITRFAELYNSKLQTDCGSIGCAIGHGSYAGIPKNTNEDWYDYSERVFGLSVSSHRWMYCFSSAWASVPNEATPQAIAQRIRKMLKDVPP